MKHLFHINVVCQVALALILLARRHYRTHGAFTIWIVFGAAELITLLWLPNPSAQYFYVYWCSAAADVVLKCAVVVELFRNVYQVDLAEASQVRRFYASFAVIALGSVALCFAYPDKSPVPMLRWIATADKGASLMLCICFVAVVIVSRGLLWLNRDFGIGAGLVVYLPVKLTISMIVASKGKAITVGLNIVEMCAYLIALITWITFFVRPEITLVSVQLTDLQKYAAAVEQQAEMLAQRTDSAD